MPTSLALADTECDDVASHGIGISMDEDRESEGGRYQLAHEVSFINRFVGNVSQPGILLDVCCGSGLVSLGTQWAGVHKVGLDNDLSMLNKFRDRSTEIPLSVGDALHMPFANAKISCIVAVHCFDHLDRVRFLQECVRVLGSGGVLILEALNRTSYKWVLKKLLFVFKNGPSNRWRAKWINIWSCREVLRTLDDCGFDVQAVYGYNWVPSTQGSNSRLIGPAAVVEHALHLDRLFLISPRCLVVARKRDVCGQDSV